MWAAIGAAAKSTIRAGFGGGEQVRLGLVEVVQARVGHAATEQRLDAGGILGEYLQDEHPGAPLDRRVNWRRLLPAQ